MISTPVFVLLRGWCYFPTLDSFRLFSLNKFWKSKLSCSALLTQRTPIVNALWAHWLEVTMTWQVNCNVMTYFFFTKWFILTCYCCARVHRKFQILSYLLKSLVFVFDVILKECMVSCATLRNSWNNHAYVPNYRDKYRRNNLRDQH